MTTLWEQLTKHADGIKHAMFFELSLCTGWEGSNQRLDAWSIPLWPSLSHEGIHAYEVKTSRSDFLRELKQPEKRQAAIKRSHYFYFVTSEKVVKSIDEIPDDSGWMFFDGKKITIMKKAPKHECGPPDWGTVRAICRRMFDFEVIKVASLIKELTAVTKDPSHEVVNALGEWAMHESGKKNYELVKQIKDILAPTKQWQWIDDGTKKDEDDDE